MIEDEFRKALAHKRRGGVGLRVGVSKDVWLGGMIETREHEPFVWIGPADSESEDELTFFADRSALESFIDRLLVVANEAWGPRVLEE